MLLLLLVWRHLALLVRLWQLAGIHVLLLLTLTRLLVDAPSAAGHVIVRVLLLYEVLLLDLLLLQVGVVWGLAVS
jgi:hypothetical protein